MKKAEAQLRNAGIFKLMRLCESQLDSFHSMIRSPAHLSQ